MARLYPGLVEIYREAFPTYLRISSRSRRQGTVSCLRTRLTRRVYQTYCVRDQGQLAGFALVIPTRFGTHLDYLAVAARFRGRGFAQQLLETVIKAHPRLLLECEDYLVKFYQRFGFVDSGIPYAYRGYRMNLLTRGLSEFGVSRLLSILAILEVRPSVLPWLPPYLHYAWVRRNIPFSKHDAWGEKG